MRIQSPIHMHAISTAVIRVSAVIKYLDRMRIPGLPGAGASSTLSVTPDGSPECVLLFCDVSSIFPDWTFSISFPLPNYFESDLFH